VSSAADDLERVIRGGGLAVFPADTVYGIACSPDDAFAVERLYLLKRRPKSKPSGVMFFGVEAALRAFPSLGERTRSAITALLPGGLTLLLPNPLGAFPLACGEDLSTIGVRVPDVPLLAEVGVPVLQSSANLAGGADPRRLDDVPELLKAACDVVIDGGELPGTPSTVVDLRRYEDEGHWSVVRAGAVSEAALGAVLGWQFHFDPRSYAAEIRADIPAFDEFEGAVVAASGDGAGSILELGTGTGETAARLLEHHGAASLVGIDVSEPMLEVARSRLPAGRISLHEGRLQDPLPPGSFELVASALCVHHLDGREKADLFARVARALAPGGRFVLGDVVVPEDPGDARIELTDGYDKPSTVAEQLGWLRDAGLDACVTWSDVDLAVIVAQPADATR
jgi:tRNA threonylcarbamoyl adenosine modification protein (Sua5/YciO/YrdC/YwlC family)